MKILITGTNGFIGRNLKEYFQDRYEKIFFPKRMELNLLDAKAVSSYLKVNSFDIIVHCGVTLTSVEENLKMLQNVVDVVCNVSPVLRHVHLVHGAKYYGAHLGRY